MAGLTRCPVLGSAFTLGGAFVWPNSLSPQVTMVPSSFKATLCWNPAAIAMTSFNPFGMVLCPEVFLPHATTVPSSFSARLCLLPMSIEMTFPEFLRSSGGKRLSEAIVMPQPITVPSALNAKLWVAPPPT